MPSSPSSSAQAAREALAVRLTHLRKDAGLSGKELSARCGWHPAKTTRIQKGAAAPADADIRAWCAACGADDQTGDLIATARAVDSMYMERRRLHRNGMRKVQEDFSALHEKAAVCRVYASNGVPGFFQTPGYATAQARSQAAAPVSGDLSARTAYADSERPTKVPPLLLEEWMPAFLAQLAAPGAQFVRAATSDGAQLLFVCDPERESFAAFTRDGEDWTVRQGGPMALWDDIERSLTAWQDAGSPDITAVHLHITADAHTYRIGDNPALRWQHSVR
ncbi:Scr1 family TA system antitoxin-like transcriptional regulator [Streptomyces cucumeris]|uniref:Scr1 family TA system antitoxin-like transcriptional regulator n=1 Tax=Streptomyces cucumeris TaxID=2962890 RepID=UPI003EB90265